MDTQLSQGNRGEYVYQHVTSEILSQDFGFSERAPAPGDFLPRFDLPLADGGWISADELIGDRPVLLITGSYTCPMTASSNPLLKQLYAKFAPDVRFITLHVREAHPGEHRDQPRTEEEKLRYARWLAKRDGLPWPIAVDGIEGPVHRALDEKPNAAYVADRDGRIVFRALWAGDVEGLTQALWAVVRGERPHRSESTRRLAPMAQGLGVMQQMLEHAGPRAKRDLWRAAPPMAALAWTAGLYRPLPPKWRAAAAAATLAGGLAVTAAVIARAAGRSR